MCCNLLGSYEAEQQSDHVSSRLNRVSRGSAACLASPCATLCPALGCDDDGGVATETFAGNSAAEHQSWVLPPCLGLRGAQCDAAQAHHVQALLNATVVALLLPGFCSSAARLSAHSPMSL